MSDRDLEQRKKMAKTTEEVYSGPQYPDPGLQVMVHHKPFSVQLLEFLKRIPIHVTLILIGVVWFLPTVGLLVSSFRTAAAIRSTGWWVALAPPYEFTLHNYIHVMTQQDIGNGFFNSLTIAIPSTVMPILVAAFAGYVLGQYRFPGRNTLFLIIIGLLIVPLQLTLVPILRIFNAVNLTGRFPAVWIAHSAYGLSFAIYLLRNYIGEIPREIFDIARIDGADNFQIFYRLVLRFRCRQSHRCPSFSSCGRGTTFSSPSCTWAAHRMWRPSPWRSVSSWALAAAGGTTSRRQHSFRWCYLFCSSSPCSATLSAEYWQAR